MKLKISFFLFFVVHFCFILTQDFVLVVVIVVADEDKNRKTTAAMTMMMLMVVVDSMSSPTMRTLLLTVLYMNVSDTRNRVNAAR